MDVLIPGSYRGWAVAGPLVTWLVVWGVWVARIRNGSQGAGLTTVDTLALPAFGRYFPIWSTPGGLAHAWLVVVPWLAGLVFVLNAGAVGRSLFARSAAPSTSAPASAGPPP